MNTSDTPIVMEVVTDPEEIARAKAQHARFRRNSDWLQDHIAEVYSQHRGQCICVAGQQLFVAPTAEAAVKLAREAHPEDDGFLMRYIPKEKMERIYAPQWAVAPVR
jgi:hypothetical protein